MEGNLEYIVTLLTENEDRVYEDTLIVHMLEQNKSLISFKKNYAILCEETGLSNTVSNAVSVLHKGYPRQKVS